jgi:hypothetical protein
MVIGVVINMGSLMYGGDVRGYIYGGMADGCSNLSDVFYMFKQAGEHFTQQIRECIKANCLIRHRRYSLCYIFKLLSAFKLFIPFSYPAFLLNKYIFIPINNNTNNHSCNYVYGVYIWRRRCRRC